MPKILPANLFEMVNALLAAHPEGLSLGTIEAAYAGSVSRRTLQRRLDEWTRSASIGAVGSRRGRRYFSSPAFVAEPSPTLHGWTDNRLSASAELSADASLSLEGREIQRRVRTPLANRVPIGYQRDFLDSYVPNVSAYLPDVLRNHLHEVGRTAAANHPAGTYVRNILNRLLIDLSWASSRLEGNTYSLLDTRELIEHGIAADGKDAKETQMILNHKAAIEFLAEASDDIAINRYTLTNLHALLSDNLLDDPRGAGALRTRAVAIGATTYLPPASPPLIADLFERLIVLGNAIRDPFEQSLFMMVHLPYLQPFIDVNKRTSRLAANIPLIQRNLVPLSFVDVPQPLYVDAIIGVYEWQRVELLRDVYVWAYERSARQYKTIRDSLAEPDPLRLRYRAAMTEVIGHVVRTGVIPTDAQITEIATVLVDAADLNSFSSMVAQELAHLHEGNIARFRLRPSEFRRWREILSATPRVPGALTVPPQST